MRRHSAVTLWTRSSKTLSSNAEQKRRGTQHLNCCRVTGLHSRGSSYFIQRLTKNPDEWISRFLAMEPPPFNSERLVRVWSIAASRLMKILGSVNVFLRDETNMSAIKRNKPLYAICALQPNILTRWSRFMVHNDSTWKSFSRKIGKLRVCEHKQLRV